jgi:hypothetical protein
MPLRLIDLAVNDAKVDLRLSETGIQLHKPAGAKREIGAMV